MSVYPSKGVMRTLALHTSEEAGANGVVFNHLTSGAKRSEARISART